ncbi:phosphatase PAP2 family protein [Lacticaseibacillus saniviri]|uniref:phosphatase PAP2 family protein n=1 Tax=Lacticaseibacillus saniviri TaxID=931533 RepID=UPI001EDDD62D|nr:phosphatase PAP2 family protein [Lacticaseibacillus saniviri]MCG4283092.1 phosphatase PAP2 family protein [Lacticaseibacillus saniviri]
MARHKPAITVFSLSLIGFIIILISVQQHAAWIPQFDQAIISPVIAHRPAWLTNILLSFTWLGSPVQVSIIGILIALILVIYKNPRYAALLAVNVLIFSGLNSIIKHMIQRPRPFVADPSIVPLAPIGGYSFPSGHSSGTMLLYGTLILMTWITVKNPKWRWLWTILAAALILATGLSRIYVQVHYPSDVLAGYLEGLIGISLTWLIGSNWVVKQRQLP